MKYLNEELIDNLNFIVGEDIVDGMKLMIKNGYTIESLMSMPIGDILDYYDNYYKPNTQESI